MINNKRCFKIPPLLDDNTNQGSVYRLLMAQALTTLFDGAAVAEETITWKEGEAEKRLEPPFSFKVAFKGKNKAAYDRMRNLMGRLSIIGRGGLTTVILL